MSRKTPPAEQPGRPTFYGEPMRPRSIRLTEAQHEKLNALGGNAWVRRKIDAAKLK